LNRVFQHQLAITLKTVGWSAVSN